MGCVVLYPNTEPCGGALTQGLVGAAPLYHLVLPLAGEHCLLVGWWMLACAGGLGQAGALAEWLTPFGLGWPPWCAR